MSIFADYDDRFAGLQKRVARFLGAAVVAAVIVVIAIVTKQEIFASTTTLYFKSSDATDLFEGMAVKMRGFNVGKVRKVTMEADASIKVQLEMKNEYMPFIRMGSVFRLAGKNLFEDAVISVRLAPMSNLQVEPDSTLSLVREPGMSEMAGKLVQQIEPVLVEVRQAVASINDPQGDVHRVINNANVAVSKIADAGSAFTKAGVQFTKASDQFHTLAIQSQALVAEDKEKWGKLLDESNTAVSTINESLPATLKKIETSLANIEAATVDLKRVTAESAATVSPLLKDGKDIIGATKNSWPIRNMLDQPEEKTLTPDSYVPKK